jgi:hypothetical protein
MRVQVIAHDMLTLAVRDPDGQLEVSVPEGTDVRGLIEVLSERSPLFDPRALLAVKDHVQLSPSQVLQEGDQVHLYMLIGGG